MLCCLLSVSCQQRQAEFTKIDANNIGDNVFSLFNDKWFVVTAGNGDVFNPMTISWGGMGILWGSPVATIYIRHSRYTYQFIEDGKYFTLCTFDEKYRDAAQYFGSHSGRDEDKIKKSGLTPLKTDLGNVYFEEARLVIECEKVYSDDLDPQFIFDERSAKMYEDPDSWHKMFVGKILNVWIKK